MVQQQISINSSPSSTTYLSNASLHDTMDNVHQLSRSTKDCNYNIYLALRQINTVRGKISSLGLTFGPKELIELAKTDHLIWRARINQMLWGNVELDAADVANAAICRLGIMICLSLR